MLTWLTWFRWATLIIILSITGYYGYRTTPWSVVDVTVTAYWVQAIGTIIAILVSFHLMRKQSAAAVKLVADTDIRTMQRRAQAVSAVIDRAYQKLCMCIDNARKAAEKQDDISIRAVCTTSRVVLNHSRVTLEQIPAHELGSYTLVQGLHLVIDAISMFERMAESWQRQPQGTLTPQDILKEVPDLAKMAKEAKETVMAGLVDIGVT
ncbi:hypothetical protein [Janthinobacterium sp. 61]|uniref:hypothetical protein n=1 Tax=Janthinobacterium sp. 61 TaxID=2035209 RepID=UPI000C7159DC|nr:hypothetical protein [Janthinobacterium sp. 61]